MKTWASGRRNLTRHRLPLSQEHDCDRQQSLRDAIAPWTVDAQGPISNESLGKQIVPRVKGLNDKVAKLAVSVGRLRREVSRSTLYRGTSLLINIPPPRTTMGP